MADAHGQDSVLQAFAKIQASLDAIRSGKVAAFLSRDQGVAARLRLLEEEQRQFVEFLDLLHRTDTVLLAAADSLRPAALLQRLCDALASHPLIVACWAALRISGRMAGVAGAGWRAGVPLAGSGPAGMEGEEGVPCFTHLADGVRILHASDCPRCPLRCQLDDGVRIALLPFVHGEDGDGILALCLAPGFRTGEAVQGLFDRLAGAVGLAVGRLRAVQEKAELARRLSQAQKLEAIGTMAAGIAHDFNNILTAIMGFAELARQRSAGCGQESGDLEQVIRAAERARELVGQLLLFSRESEQSTRPVELQPLVKESLKLLRAAIPPTVRLEEEMAAPGMRVEADPARIHQVVMNLCTNAYQAMKKEGGVLSVSLRRVELAGAAARRLRLRPGAYLCLRVRDTGCGIADDLLERIFDPYVTTKAPGEGTGLGLAVVQRVVADCGGAIDVESEVGQGSTFDVYLPVVEGGEDPGAAAGSGGCPSSLPAGQERLLVVDDDPAVTDLVVRHLVPLGYRVEGCGRPEEALARLAGGRFDGVVVDLLMPGMNGLRLLEKIRDHHPRMAAVLMTGLGSAVEPAGLTGKRSAQLLLKPFSQQQLATAVRRALDSVRQQPDA